MTLFNLYVATLRARYGGFQLFAKEFSPVMQRVYRWTLMRFWCPTFLIDFATTFGTRVFMPSQWIDSTVGYKVLRHEAIHVEDYVHFGWFFSVTYVLPFPIGPLSLRWWWELRAYKETMRTEYEVTGEIPDSMIEAIVEILAGPTYLWAFPFRKTMRGWLQAERARIFARS